MKIAFADFVDWEYKIESVYKMPLGGSQSALCYLASALAKQGHEVFLLNETAQPGMSGGVMCLPLKTAPDELLQSLDALIVLNYAEEGMQLRSHIGNNTRLILWTQHAADRGAVQALQNAAERDVYDGFAFVSNWQRDSYLQNCNIDRKPKGVLRNAIAPSFCGLFPDETPIQPQKSQPPILAYTSTPFRGLDVLLEVFPRIRQAVPGTTLKVFSSMKVYQIPESKDESVYGELYRLCRETEGVEYIGSLPQPDLARQLRSIMVLAYPNTFRETSCIAVMEAMASGCRVVTSELAALPETTAGFGCLIPIEDDWEVYKNRFVEETVRVLKECTASDTSNAETFLKRQVSYVNNEYTWSVRAEQWVEWLCSIDVKTAVPLDSDANCEDLQQQAYEYFLQGEYDRAASLYEQAIEACPSVTSNYWYLGLILLLQDEEVEAQTTWALPVIDADTEQIDRLTAELEEVLQAEAKRRDALGDFDTAELIREYLP